MNSTSFCVSSSSSTCKIRIIVAPQAKRRLTHQYRWERSSTSYTLKLRSHRSDAHEHLHQSVRHLVGQSHTSPLKESSRQVVGESFAVSVGSNSEKNRGVRDW